MDARRMLNHKLIARGPPSQYAEKPPSCHPMTGSAPLRQGAQWGSGTLRLLVANLASGSWRTADARALSLIEVESKQLLALRPGFHFFHRGTSSDFASPQRWPTKPSSYQPAFPSALSLDEITPLSRTVDFLSILSLHCSCRVVSCRVGRAATLQACKVLYGNHCIGHGCLKVRLYYVVPILMPSLTAYNGFPIASHYCKASPDGRLVAAIHDGSIHVRATGTLQTVNVIKLPTEFSTAISVFCWSPSSSRLLVSSADRILVLSARDGGYRATISNPLGPITGKSPMIQFGGGDDEVLVSAPLGLKFIVFDLGASKAVEISNSKSTLSQSPHRTFSIRPDTGHLAIITRISGKDMVSIHRPTGRQVARSWHPDLLDAQGIMWTPDGQWLLMWEVAAQGRKLVIYSADGELFRTLDANALAHDGDARAMPELEPGIRACQLSPNGELCVLGDSGRGVTVVHTNIWRSAMTLKHPGTITPGETLQVRRHRCTRP